MAEHKEKNRVGKTREYLANERTFLAWIRTGIALMGFGFIIVKFTLFLREISLMLEPEGTSSAEYSELVGVIMVALGVIIAVLAFIQYNNHCRNLDIDTFIPSPKLPMFITLIILSGGIILVLYLITII
ncbi:MAG: DUF202 domain-containing protein [Bacteroidales bacterium]|nr:DUF202 domain-containing protein [Bacteroidales bacterium]